MRFDKFVSKLSPKINASNAVMNMFYCVSLMNSMYYTVYPKFRDLRTLVSEDADEGSEKYDLTSKHVINLAWAIFFICFALVFNSALSLMINFVSLSVAVMSIISIVLIVSRREKVMFKEFGRKIQNDDVSI